MTADQEAAWPTKHWASFCSLCRVCFAERHVRLTVARAEVSTVRSLRLKGGQTLHLLDVDLQDLHQPGDNRTPVSILYTHPVGIFCAATGGARERETKTQWNMFMPAYKQLLQLNRLNTLIRNGCFCFVLFFHNGSEGTFWDRKNHFALTCARLRLSVTPGGTTKLLAW